ncbi:MAG: radical SAM protein [Candidatus Magasanikbacteria bacterium]|nr:radical SAM protein [Candidatus Magasanikbacteria bacterium]
MKNILSELEKQGRIVYKVLKTIRVKLHTPCQFSCHFCHMEGNQYSTPIDDIEKLITILDKFRREMNISEVHFTGGEPSIHPNVIKYIKRCKQEGFDVKMTTNGVTYLDRYLECIESGLSSLNVSLHTLNPTSLSNTMEPPRSIRWGQKTIITTQFLFLKEISSLISVKVNTCVGSNELDALEIAEFCETNNLEWRAMNQLGIPKESYASLSRMSTTLKAVPVEAIVTNGSSSFSITMRVESGFIFKIKLIRPFMLASICNNCSLEQNGECHEYVYGPRLEKEGDRLKVRSCLHRQKEPFVLPFEDFFQHRIFSEFKEHLLKK